MYMAAAGLPHPFGLPASVLSPQSAYGHPAVTEMYWRQLSSNFIQQQQQQQQHQQQQQQQQQHPPNSAGSAERSSADVRAQEELLIAHEREREKHERVARYPNLYYANFNFANLPNSFSGFSGFSGSFDHFWDFRDF